MFSIHHRRLLEKIILLMKLTSNVSWNILNVMNTFYIIEVLIKYSNIYCDISQVPISLDSFYLCIQLYIVFTIITYWVDYECFRKTFFQKMLYFMYPSYKKQNLTFTNYSNLKTGQQIEEEHFYFLYCSVYSQ